jgi:hypothetical protein
MTDSSFHEISLFGVDGREAIGASEASVEIELSDVTMVLAFDEEHAGWMID